MISKNGAVYGNSNKEAMIRSNTTKDSHKGFYPSFLETLNTRQFPSKNRFLTYPTEEINTTVKVTKEWATSKNKRRAHLRSIMTMNALQRDKDKTN